MEAPVLIFICMLVFVFTGDEDGSDSEDDEDYDIEDLGEESGDEVDDDEFSASEMLGAWKWTDTLYSASASVHLSCPLLHLQSSRVASFLLQQPAFYQRV